VFLHSLNRKGTKGVILIDIDTLISFELNEKQTNHLEEKDLH